MDQLHKITIHQTLHGYKAGHKLISSSIDLSDIERRAMLIYSDYAGSGIEKEFLSYLTGYPLPNSKFYVFAKSWYASEMKRPGCVWTHSLLIDFTDLWEIGDMRALLRFFARPDQDLHVSKYSSTIEVSQKQFSVKYPISQNFYSISYELYGNPTEGLVILAKSSIQFEDEILDIWNWQWPRMKRNFTFSTGSLSLRMYEGKSFDLQIAPIRRQRAMMPSELDQIRIVAYDELPLDNDWITKYRSIELREMQDFMIKYGSDVAGTRANFGALLDSIFLATSKNIIDSNALAKFFNTYFIDPASARQLKLKVVDVYFKGTSESKFSLLDILLSHRTFSGVSWDFKKMFKALVDDEKIEEDQINILLNKMSESKITDELSKVLSILPVKVVAKSNINSSHLIELVNDCPSFQSETIYWRLETEIQKKWFDIFKKNIGTNWHTVTKAMLDAQFGKFADEVYEIVGEDVFSIIAIWLSENNKRLSVEWKEIIRMNQGAFFVELTEMNQLSKNIIDIILEIFSPYDKYWKSVSTELIQKFLRLVVKTKLETEITGIYTFFITACYQNNLKKPEAVNTLLFQRLHDKLQDDIVEINTWERFKWYMGRDLHLVVEQNYFSKKLFGDKSKVPDWDRCEFLRRSFVVSYLKYDWDPLTILNSIDDKKTFEKVVAFCIEIKEGYQMIKFVYKSLKSIKEEQSFHFKVLKNMIG